MVNSKMAMEGTVAEEWREAPTGDPRATWAASEFPTRRANDHRTGEQYPVKNKRFTQLSSSGGIK